ncbi:hypothetical protein CERSUDRAFT_75101 [Gelatoporia subvermispora B]|uniref:Peptidase C14 caspase domain-containing protein n=1 Tax=Ceriporiopsis subvermispora (strain B) TaxID=914234 RepID=M2R9T2_CERS8|nr:hypothetical protein CERSUDRAFT_75101 [Gelatoporia subvermispora B]
MSADGVRKALLVAIHYPDLAQHEDNLPLLGTYTDPELIKALLVDTYQWKEYDIKVLKDDDEHEQPTKENILRAMGDLVASAQAGDKCLFAFSGHGSQVPNLDGTEEDGFDEVIWPVDIVYNDDHSMVENYIIDDHIHDVLVKNMPAGAEIVMIFDCCHSGTAAGFPNIDPPSDLPCNTEVSTSVTHKHFANGEALVTKHSMRHNLKDGQTQEPQVEHSDAAADKFSKKFKEASLEAIVQSWSACRDEEATYEMKDGGLLVKGFTESLTETPNPTNGELLELIR